MQLGSARIRTLVPARGQKTGADHRPCRWKAAGTMLASNGGSTNPHFAATMDQALTHRHLRRRHAPASQSAHRPAGRRCAPRLGPQPRGASERRRRRRRGGRSAARQHRQHHQRVRRGHTGARGSGVEPRSPAGSPRSTPSRASRSARGELLLELDDREIRLALDSAARNSWRSRTTASSRWRRRWSRSASSSPAASNCSTSTCRPTRVKLERIAEAARQRPGVGREPCSTAELNVKRTEIQLRQQRELIDDTRRATAQRHRGRQAAEGDPAKADRAAGTAAGAGPRDARPSPAC